jgi:hypothetical protein
MLVLVVVQNTNATLVDTLDMYTVTTRATAYATAKFGEPPPE